MRKSNENADPEKKPPQEAAEAKGTEYENVATALKDAERAEQLMQESISEAEAFFKEKGIEDDPETLEALDDLRAQAKKLIKRRDELTLQSLTLQEQLEDAKAAEAEKPAAKEAPIEVSDDMIVESVDVSLEKTLSGALAAYDRQSEGPDSDLEHAKKFTEIEPEMSTDSDLAEKLESFIKHKEDFIRYATEESDAEIITHVAIIGGLDAETEAALRVGGKAEELRKHILAKADMELEMLKKTLRQHEARRLKTKQIQAETAETVPEVKLPEALVNDPYKFITENRTETEQLKDKRHELPPWQNAMIQGQEVLLQRAAAAIEDQGENKDENAVIGKTIDMSISEAEASGLGRTFFAVKESVRSSLKINASDIDKVLKMTEASSLPPNIKNAVKLQAKMALAIISGNLVGKTLREFDGKNCGTSPDDPECKKLSSRLVALDQISYPFMSAIEVQKSKDMAGELREKFVPETVSAIREMFPNIPAETLQMMERRGQGIDVEVSFGMRGKGENNGGIYDSKAKKITVRASNVEKETQKNLLMTHELLHGLSHNDETDDPSKNTGLKLDAEVSKGLLAEEDFTPDDWRDAGFGMEEAITETLTEKILTKQGRSIADLGYKKERAALAKALEEMAALGHSDLFERIVAEYFGNKKEIKTIWPTDPDPTINKKYQSVYKRMANKLLYATQAGRGVSDPWQ
ncbi:hypothetical protein HY633_02025 [Candidatus Uhrbacteria bacterium]|nr:hypothetical protein [Candidatus Uhrbacteria bacterium]